MRYVCATSTRDAQKVSSATITHVSLLGSAPEERDLRSVHEDPQVQPEGHVLDVEKIVPHLLGDLLEAHRIAVAHLGPAGEPGAHHVAEGVVGDQLCHQLDVCRDLGTRADQVHVTLEDGPE